MSSKITKEKLNDLVIKKELTIEAVLDSIIEAHKMKEMDIVGLSGYIEDYLEGKMENSYDTDKTITKAEIQKLIITRGLTITEVIDAVIELNRFVGVGLISLGDDLQAYCHRQINPSADKHKYWYIKGE